MSNPIILYTTPQLLSVHIAGAEGKFKSRQSVYLPDFYQRFELSPRPPRLVRYRVCVDTSHLGQSGALAEVWSGHGQGWVELCQLHFPSEFYVGSSDGALDPDTPELLSSYTQDPSRIVRSWQKIYERLACEAETVLEVIG